MKTLRIRLTPVYDGWVVEKARGYGWIHWLPSAAEMLYGVKSYKTKELALSAAKREKDKALTEEPIEMEI